MRMLVGTACLMMVSSTLAAEASARVVAFPGPGWGFASPQTRLTLQGVSAGDIEGLTVTGSRTGRHDGSLHALRIGTGAVFTPSEPFAPGERVEVRLGRPVHGARGGSFTFRIAEAARGRKRGAGAGPPTRRPAQRFRAPRLRTIAGPKPPGLRMRRLQAGRPGPRRILVSPRPPSDLRQPRPSLMMLDGRGRILWYQPRRTVVHDLHRTVLDGRPVLAYYVRQHGRPTYHEVLDSSYRPVTRIHAGNGYRVNAHELQITERGTAYVCSYRAVRVRGKDVVDFVVQEIDLETRDVLFEWHALDHVPLWASYARAPEPGEPWDYFHGNSVEPPTPGDDTIIVSARKTSAVYCIDRGTGAVRWTLGGAQDQFGLAARHPRWRFCAQHDARRLPDGDLSIFDNGGTALSHGTRCPVHRSRVLRFELDERRKRVRLVRSISSRPSSDDGRGYFAGIVGSARWDARGDVLVSWGETGRVTQVAPSGRVRFKLQLEHWSYRATRARWAGRPAGRPAVAARRRGGGAMDVYASWNGATNVARWRVLRGPGPDELRPAGRSFRWADLETRMRVRGAASVAVEAVDRAGEVVGRSAAVRPR